MKSKKTIIKMQILWTIVLIIIELMSNMDTSAAHRSSHPSISNNDLIEPNIKSYKLSVYASDNCKPSRLNPLLPVLVQVFQSEDTQNITLFDVFEPTVNLIRHKRSVRPTKSYEYKESDGAVQGMIVFQLDKKHTQEVYKIETPNRWVNVDTSGAVKVKKSWDYEQLGKEKTIDFWVYATGPHLNGMSYFRYLFAFI